MRRLEKARARPEKSRKECGEPSLSRADIAHIPKFAHFSITANVMACRDECVAVLAKHFHQFTVDSVLRRKYA